ncbi:uncharacterized protein LOC108147304 [Drosophila elegans]|uniref:uncharacterized protein LOC108147304 n=1 Tax=Drosophila elegans TaxID=30023 RepID=UPI0007E81582|nr:uncharacterized protein LOC108147304 [Drosophila elegans]
MASYSYKDRAQEMIKCFCGCTDMTVEEVLRVHGLFGRVKDILSDPLAAKLFGQFMKERRSGDKNETEQYLEIYKMCIQLKSQPIITQGDLSELINRGLPRELEQDLTKCVLSGNPMEITRCLGCIQVKCSNEIGGSAEFHDFKKAIEEKLGRVPKELK